MIKKMINKKNKIKIKMIKKMINKKNKIKIKRKRKRKRKKKNKIIINKYYQEVKKLN